MADYADPLAVYRTSGIDPASLAVAAGRPKTDPNNPLGLSAAAPGYLPADQRPAQRDPDLGWQEGMSPGQIIATPDQLPVDLRNKVSQAQRDWGEMDSSYWAAHSQKPLPIVLGALGAIAAPFALSALGLGAAGAGAAGAGAGGAGAGAVGTGLTAGALGAGAGAVGAGTTVSELVITAAASGWSIPAIAAAVGIPAATVGSILSSSGGGGSNALQGSQGADTVSPTTTVDPLTVTATPKPPVLPGVATAAGGLGAIGALAGSGGDTPLPLQDNLAPVQPPSVSGPLNNPPAFTPTPNTPPSLMTAIKSGDVGAVGDWIKANPLQAVQLGLLSASALSTVAGDGTPSNNASGTYHPVDLPASFSATSPHFALAGRGTPRIMPTQDWTKYGQGPEQSFFTGVNQPASITNLSVAKPPVAVPDRIHPKPRGYAHGGFAVRGDGDGRSDSIDAKLSDGEYVMDAETVALLGNGSNRAGADKLDQFRVNLRKDKGRGLARGEFSVHAKDPMAYARGGR